MWTDRAINDVVAQARAQSDPERAAAMASYFKMEPFIGIGVPERRAIEKAIWRTLPDPTSDELTDAARTLRNLPERELHLSGAEILGKWRHVLEPTRLNTDIREAILTKPWWDTVDLLGNKVITPMVRDNPELVDVMWEWNATQDEWLIRASIQHQRGRKDETDLQLLFDLCEPHTADRRFFVAKGIGWALRDTSRLDVDAVQEFVDRHPELPAVARREAVRGIAREREAAS